MTRAELRRQARKNAKKDKVYTLTQAQIDKMKEDTFDEAIGYSFGLMLSIPTNILAKHYWEKSAPKRIPKFIDECMNLYERVGARTIQISDLIKDVEEISNIKLDCINRIKKLNGN